MLDPSHPKNTMWLSRGTMMPDDMGGLERLDIPEGVLLSVDRGAIRYFDLMRSDEALAEVLGYVEPKSRVSGTPVIVRACDDRGSAITEMACSAHNVARAMLALAGHGNIEITSMMAVLHRRLRLC